MALRKAREMKDCENIDYYVGTTYGEYDTKRRYPELNEQQIQACKSPESVFADLNRISGIFFTGGDQSLHKSSFIDSKGDSAEMKIIRQRVNSGACALAGTSAGTAVQGGSSDSGVPMIAGGESYEALVNKPLDHLCLTSLCYDDLQYDPEGGLGLFNVGILDTHFSQRGRQGRLVRLAMLTNNGLAMGVDETTGLLAVSDGQATNFEVIGEYGVTLFDLRQAKGSDNSASAFRVQGVSLSYFTDGDKFSLSALGRIDSTVASYKKKVIERGKADSTTDIFSSPNRSGGRANYMRFVEIDTGLIQSADTSTYGETYETNPQIYKVNFTKLSNTQGYKGTDKNGDERFTILGLDLSIQPKILSEKAYA
jgi:cyanophycinase